MGRPLNDETSASMCAHMNDDHAEAIAGYARAFGAIADVRSARMRSIDAKGMDLDLDTDTGPAAVRIPFDHELVDADDARQTLIAMAQRA